MSKRYTICVDFDGVIHSYASGWLGADVLPDPPNAGAIEWLRSMLSKFDVTILTTRGQYPEGREAVTRWLIAHGLRPEEAQRILVTNEKCAALVYIDDRAIRFEGKFPTADEIHQARPWHKP